MSIAETVEEGLDSLFRLWGWKKPPTEEGEPVSFSAPWEPKEIYGNAKVEKHHSCIYCEESNKS
ncbi:MAG: hypothetical protein DDT33_01681 [Firmicutes bacterium]|nr:hypothetical protein [Bacillota bacterium]